MKPNLKWKPASSIEEEMDHTEATYVKDGYKFEAFVEDKIADPLGVRRDKGFGVNVTVWKSGTSLANFDDWGETEWEAQEKAEEIIEKFLKEKKMSLKATLSKAGLKVNAQTWMNVIKEKKLANKNLELSVDDVSKIEDLTEDDLLDYLHQRGYDSIAPEDIGALTSTPFLFGEVDRDNKDNIAKIYDIWWYPDYQVKDAAEELREKGKVVFTYAKDKVEASMKKDDLKKLLVKSGLNVEGSKKPVHAYTLKGMLIKAGLEVEEVKAADPSLKPPKKWWDKMHKQVKEKNPSYSEEQIRKTIGSIWYNLSKAKRVEIRQREGKTLGPAKK